MRYINITDEGMHSHDWGGDPTYWMEIDEWGDAERQIEQYPNGNVISYDSIYRGDDHSELSLMAIDGDEIWWQPHFIPQEEFERAWREHRPINREFPPAVEAAA
jgi:hypothetical protein